MNFSKRSRMALGFLSMFVGTGLLLGAAHASSHPELGLSSKTVVVTASAVSGSVLTFVVARRLLTHAEEVKERSRGTRT